MTEMAEKIGRIETDVCWLKKAMSNHLKHHFMITLAAITTTVGAITAIILILVKG